MSFLERTARVAVASSVHGRVQRRQQSRWAAAEQAVPAPPVVPAAPVPPAMPVEPPQPAADAAAVSVDIMIEQLTKLGELHRAGVLTDADFGTQKALLLARPRV